MRLYHAGPSYYSMIARLALVETGQAFESVIVDIHRRGQQMAPEYARLNPNMTVPTLRLDDGRVLTESRDVLELAFPTAREEPARGLVDRHYAFPIEELTIGSLITRNPLARRVFPRGLVKSERRLRTLAEANPDLRDVYLRRAEIFAERRRTFDPSATAALFTTRLADAEALLDHLEGALADGRAMLTGDTYGGADVVWTVFLARLAFIGQSGLVDRRPALARWRGRVFARPSFEAADVWNRWKLGKWLRQVLG